jgi:hypothetical protein
MDVEHLKLIVKRRIIGRHKKIEIKRIRELTLPYNHRYFVIGQYLLTVDRCSVNFFDFGKR